MSSDTVISIKNLSKCYKIYHKPQDRLLQMLAQGQRKYYQELWALKDITFQVKKGESFGIIGRNGSGKSTLLQILAGTLDQTSGEVLVNGRIAALLELGSGFNPDFTGRENIFLNGSILGLKKQEIEERYDEIVKFADIGDFIDQPVKTYSSGMFMRLAFAVQAHVDASIVIIDEALTVGDIFFRQKCYSRLDQLRNAGAATLLVTHSMQDIEQYCDRSILLDGGVQKFIGPSREATKHYYLLHQSVSKSPSVSITQKVFRASDLSEESIQDFSLDLTGKRQVSNGQAQCTSVVIFDTTGKPCNTFRQGDKAIFCYEFFLLEDIGVPICGMTISTEKGIIVFGKNSWQCSESISINYGEKTFVSCHQEVKLDIAPGEYLFQVGLASCSQSDWNNRENISSEQESLHIKRVCHIPDVGSFSIGVYMRDDVPHLTHHGLVNLASNIKVKMNCRE